MVLEFKKSANILTLGKINKIQMVIHLMDENLLQKENLLTKTLSFSFLVQKEENLQENPEQLQDNRKTLQDSRKTYQDSRKETIELLKTEFDKFKIGINNRIINENLTKLNQINSPLSVEDCKKFAKEISTNIETYNTSIAFKVEQMEELFQALIDSFSQLDSTLIRDMISNYKIDSNLLLNVLKENFINKVRALLPANILLTKVNLTAFQIDAAISEDTNCLNIKQEVKLWDETHILNLVGTNDNKFYYSKGFLLVQVKTSHIENLDKIIYIPNPALSKEIALNTPNNAQFLVIKSTGPSMSSLDFLITEYKNVIFSKEKNDSDRWIITPIYSINNTFVTGVKAEFIRYVQRGNISPNIQQTNYKEVVKQAIDLQKKQLQIEEEDL